MKKVIYNFLTASLPSHKEWAFLPSYFAYAFVEEPDSPLVAPIIILLDTVNETEDSLSRKLAKQCRESGFVNCGQ